MTTPRMPYSSGAQLPVQVLPPIPAEPPGGLLNYLINDPRYGNDLGGQLRAAPLHARYPEVPLNLIPPPNIPPNLPLYARLAKGMNIFGQTDPTVYPTPNIPPDPMRAQAFTPGGWRPIEGQTKEVFPAPPIDYLKDFGKIGKLLSFINPAGTAASLPSILKRQVTGEGDPFREITEGFGALQRWGDTAQGLGMATELPLPIPDELPRVVGGLQEKGLLPSETPKVPWAKEGEKGIWFGGVKPGESTQINPFYRPEVRETAKTLMRAELEPSTGPLSFLETLDRRAEILASAAQQSDVPILTRLGAEVFGDIFNLIPIGTTAKIVKSAGGALKSPFLRFIGKEAPEIAAGIPTPYADFGNLGMFTKAGTDAPVAGSTVAVPTKVNKFYTDFGDTPLKGWEIPTRYNEAWMQADRANLPRYNKFADHARPVGETALPTRYNNYWYDPPKVIPTRYNDTWMEAERATLPRPNKFWEQPRRAEVEQLGISATKYNRLWNEPPRAIPTKYNADWMAADRANLPRYNLYWKHAPSAPDVPPASPIEEATGVANISLESPSPHRIKTRKNRYWTAEDSLTPPPEGVPTPTYIRLLTEPVESTEDMLSITESLRLSKGMGIDEVVFDYESLNTLDKAFYDKASRYPRVEDYTKGGVDELNRRTDAGRLQEAKDIIVDPVLEETIITSAPPKVRKSRAFIEDLWGKVAKTIVDRMPHLRGMEWYIKGHRLFNDELYHMKTVQDKLTESLSTEEAVEFFGSELDVVTQTMLKDGIVQSARIQSENFIRFQIQPALGRHTGDTGGAKMGQMLEYEGLPETLTVKDPKGDKVITLNEIKKTRSAEINGKGGADAPYGVEPWMISRVHQERHFASILEHHPSRENPNFIDHLTHAEIPSEVDGVIGTWSRNIETMVGPEGWKRIVNAVDATAKYYQDLFNHMLVNKMISPERHAQLTKMYPNYFPTKYLEHINASAATGGRAFDSAHIIGSFKDDVVAMGAMGPLDEFVLLEQTYQVLAKVELNRASKAMYYNYTERTVGMTDEKLDWFIDYTDKFQKVVPVKDDTGRVVGERLQLYQVPKERGGLDISLREQKIRKGKGYLEFIDPVTFERRVMGGRPPRSGPIDDMEHVRPELGRTGAQVLPEGIWQDIYGPGGFADMGSGVSDGLNEGAALLSAVQGLYKAGFTIFSPKFIMANLQIDILTTWLHGGIGPHDVVKHLIKELNPFNAKSTLRGGIPTL